LASDLYVSESRYVLRSPEPEGSSPLATMLQGSGFSRVQDDMLAVQAYILSRDALAALDAELGLRAGFADPALDVLSRFPLPGREPSVENLYRYYLRKVTVQVDAAA